MVADIVNGPDATQITGETLGDATSGGTTTFFTEHDDVNSGSEQLYGDGTPIENITDLTYTVVSYATGEIDVTNNTGTTYTITADYTYNSPPYNTDQDLANTSPAAGAETGDGGGGDMSVWSQDRVTILDTLITGDPFTDNSSFGFPKAVAVGGYPQTYAEAEVTPAEPASTSEAGDGGGNMDIWGATRVTILDTLITGPPFTDKSAFALPKAVAVGDYPQTYPEAEESLAQPAAESAQGGSSNNEDMDIFTDDTIDRQTQLGTLVVGKDYDEFTGYDFPAGIYSYDWRQTVAEAEHTLDLTPAGAEEGENVAASIRFFGKVLIVEDIDDIANSDTLEIGGTTITIEGADGFQDAVTTAADDADYEVSLPKKDETDTYTITADNTYFGEKQVTITVDPNAVDHEHNVYYGIPRFSGVPSRAAQFGSPVIG